VHLRGASLLLLRRRIGGNIWTLNRKFLR